MKQRSWIVIVLASILASCGGDTGAASPGEKGGQSLPAPTSVEVERVVPRSADALIRATGTVEADRDVWLSSEVGGRIVWRLPDEGAGVAAGEPIVRFDREPAEIGLSRAEAGHEAALAAAEHAEREWTRVRELHAAGDLTDSERDGAELAQRTALAGLRDAAASLRAAERVLRETVVIAPWDGSVAAIVADIGAGIAPGQPVARLLSSDTPRTVIGLPAAEIVAIEVGDSARVSLVDLSERRWTGIVSSLATAPDPATRTYRVEIALPDATAPRIGMAVQVELVRERLAEVVMIPQSAVVVRRGSDLAFLERDGSARRRLLSLGERIDDRVRVLEGVEVDDRLIVVGHERLADGEAVEVRAER
ncbi:MAG: hypothetical protein CME06_04615 [Gemmatimonadetes bacterium]|nr:hypothetical protein [Gemmatimonadota bacterium]